MDIMHPAIILVFELASEVAVIRSAEVVIISQQIFRRRYVGQSEELPVMLKEFGGGKGRSVGVVSRNDSM